MFGDIPGMSDMLSELKTPDGNKSDCRRKEKSTTHRYFIAKFIVAILGYARNMLMGSNLICRKVFSDVAENID